MSPFAAVIDSVPSPATELLEALAEPGITDGERSLLEDSLVRMYLPMARSLAARFAGSGADGEDLTQVAAIAVLKAIRRFDGERGSFEPYARATIRGELKRHLRDHAWMIRPPRSVQELSGEVATATWSMAQDRGTTPSAADVADQIGADVTDVREVLSARTCFRALSLEQPLDASGRSLGDALPDTASEYAEVENSLAIRQLCRGLSREDRRLLVLRFVDGLTQRQIAATMGMSQMGVSRRLTSLLAILRDRWDGEPLAA